MQLRSPNQTRREPGVRLEQPLYLARIVVDDCRNELVHLTSGSIELFEIMGDVSKALLLWLVGPNVRVNLLPVELVLVPRRFVRGPRPSKRRNIRSCSMQL